MKVAIIGASGRVGGLVADELVSRGHEVTGFVIDPENVRNDQIKVVEKNVFTLTKEDLQDFDAVVTAFGQFTPGLGFQHQTAMMTLINAMKDLPDVRLLVVGGAASLFTDEAKEHRALERIPEKFHEVPSNMFEAFKMLEKSDLKWTYFSPAFTFDPKGTRTGKYKLGTDFIFNNDEGESYISYADYALAMADEIENGNFIRRRFTAVSNKNDAPEELASTKKEFPDVEFEGLSMYRAPSVLELSGKSYYLIMDDGTEGSLIFNSGEIVTWIPIGGTARADRYDCLKVDEDTYLVNLEVADAKPRTGVSLVLDLEQRLVTAVIAHSGTSRRFPSLVTNEIVFGAIKMDGRPLPKKRHGFTSDLVGSRIKWRYNSVPMAVTHVYFDANYIRVPLPPKTDQSDRAKAMRENPYDERCYYIKIKKNIYLISFLESNMTYRGRTGNNMLVLMDISRLHDVGRSFGLGGTGLPENYMFSAIGSWVDAEEEDFRESKYRV
ncbi:MAG: NAD(P)H-binding protein [Lachnospiraceae bacterium]|nr:NAD(P)H-binding protein [Lachnospiraceae bacterium]